MLEPRQMNEDGLDVREANHRMMNMLAILLALFHRNFSKFSDQCVRGAVTKFEQVRCFGPFDSNGEVHYEFVEVLREVGAATVLLGHVRGGEWLGEMGVIEGRSHSATARGDSVLARDPILRLSIRLRRIEDKIAGDLLPFAHDRSPDGADETAVAVITDDATILLAAENEAFRARIGAAAIHVAKLPFLVGRITVEGEAKPLRLPDLLIEDEAPFRLSRQHFMITRSGDRLFVSDLGSTLGTIVNGQGIGHLFTKDVAPLHRGENHVVAGGWDSPFEFLVSISQ
jgi:CRP/FNR family transcriptional regulator, cyclic AMP receptor protein